MNISTEVNHEEPFIRKESSELNHQEPFIHEKSPAQTEYHKTRKVIENADEDALCKICLDALIECVILECGYMACCINFGKQMSECPRCRQYVVRALRFFKA